jgi:hypothetical protein
VVVCGVGLGGEGVAGVYPPGVTVMFKLLRSLLALGMLVLRVVITACSSNEVSDEISKSMVVMKKSDERSIRNRWIFDEQIWLQSGKSLVMVTVVCLGVYFLITSASSVFLVKAPHPRVQMENLKAT